MNVVQFKEEVRSRDGGKCVSCGCSNSEHRLRTGRQLDVHRKSPGSEYTLEGCETLCRRCHKQAHGRMRKRTKIVRLASDVADHVAILSPIFGQTAPDFVSEILRPILERKREEGVKRLKEKKLDQ